MNKSAKILLLISIAFQSNLWSQIDTNTLTPHEQTAKWDSVQYPFLGEYTPNFIAGLFGYNFYNSQELEAGLLLNLSESNGFKRGMYFGPSFLYRRSIDRNMNALAVGIGFYSTLSFGFEINYNWNEDYNIWGAKPYVGVSFYFIQLIYGYNILNHDRNTQIGLKNHSFSLKCIIPIAKIGKPYSLSE